MWYEDRKQAWGNQEEESPDQDDRGDEWRRERALWTLSFHKVNINLSSVTMRGFIYSILITSSLFHYWRYLLFFPLVHLQCELSPFITLFLSEYLHWTMRLCSLIVEIIDCCFWLCSICLEEREETRKKQVQTKTTEEMNKAENMHCDPVHFQR